MDEPIAVIGAGGYVGARLVERAQLLEEFRLVPIVRSVHSQGRLARYGPVLLRGDAAETSSIVPLLKGSRMAINLTLGGPGSTVRNIRSIHDACRLAGVPVLVHVSTAEIFGRAEPADLTEDSLPRSRHWMEYARDKTSAELWLRIRPPGDVSTVILRPGLIWGPGSRWLVRPAQELLNGTAYVFNDGRGVCNLIHVDNLIDHLKHIADGGVVGSGTFNVADDETHSWDGFYRAIAREVGVDETSIHRLTEYPRRERFKRELTGLRQSAPVRAVTHRVPASTRETLRHWIDGAIRPPIRQPQPYTPRPAIDKSVWWAQGTVRRLPSGAFNEAFPGLRLRPFGDLMAAAGRWLRQAGFHAD